MGVFLSGPHLGPIHSGVRLSGGKKNSSGGVLGIIVLAVVIVFAIHYWFIVLPVAAVVLAIIIPMRRKAVRQQQAAEAIEAHDAREPALEAAEVQTMRQSVEVAGTADAQPFGTSIT